MYRCKKIKGYCLLREVGKDGLQRQTGGECVYVCV